MRGCCLLTLYLSIVSVTIDMAKRGQGQMSIATLTIDKYRNNLVGIIETKPIYLDQTCDTWYHSSHAERWTKKPAACWLVIILVLSTIHYNVHILLYIKLVYYPNFKLHLLCPLYICLVHEIQKHILLYAPHCLTVLSFSSLLSCFSWDNSLILSNKSAVIHYFT